MKTLPGQVQNIEYKSITLGKDIKLKRNKSISSGKQKQWRGPLLANTRNGIMLIVGNKNEFVASNPDLIIVDGSNQQLLEDDINNDTAYKPSGIVVLCMIKLERETIKTQYLWGPDDARNIKTCKTNIITAHSTHFGSTGQYYSFGNRANYGMIGKSSITQYVNKKYNKLSSQLKSVCQSNVMEDLLAKDLHNGISGLVSILPNIKQYIAPSLNICYQVQEEIGDCNMKTTAVSRSGLWQSSVCINCQTSTLHTENDCTYTVITTPNQHTDNVPVFLFEFKKGYTLGLQMDPGLTFMFSGKYLYHRQMLPDMNDERNRCYINLASYGNDKLFNHFKSTVRRVMS